MAVLQVTGSSISVRSSLPSFEGLRSSSSNVKFASSNSGLSNKRSFRGLVVKAATVVAPKYTTVKPLGDRVLIKIKAAEEKSLGGILLPSTAQSKPQSGEVVAIGEGKTLGKTKVDSSVKTGTQVVYSKYAGTELEFNGTGHLLLKEDDIVGILETDDVKDLKPLNDRVLIRYKIKHRALRKECEELMSKGITGTGEGFDCPGKRLGGFTRQPPLPLLRQSAFAAAEKRARIGSLLLSGPKRLGGDKGIMGVLSPLQAAAMAAERRMQDELWCGSQASGVPVEVENRTSIFLDFCVNIVICHGRGTLEDFV